MNDDKFEELFFSKFTIDPSGWFYSKIAGMTHPNRDGSNRIETLYAFCEPLDRLELIPEPDNPIDPEAIAVYLEKTGDRLGYLPERTAHDLLARMKDGPGSKWFGVFRASYRDETQKHIVGATIIIAQAYAPRRRGLPL